MIYDMQGGATQAGNGPTSFPDWVFAVTTRLPSLPRQLKVLHGSADSTKLLTGRVGGTWTVRFRRPDGMFEPGGGGDGGSHETVPVAPSGLTAVEV